MILSTSRVGVDVAVRLGVDVAVGVRVRVGVGARAVSVAATDVAITAS